MPMMATIHLYIHMTMMVMTAAIEVISKVGIIHVIDKKKRDENHYECLKPKETLLLPSL